MAHAENEIEVKYLIKDLHRLEVRLQALGGKLIQPRVEEVNLRFDTQDGELSREHRVLRLRRDEKVRLTYKDPAQMNRTVSVRREIEVEVSSFDETRLLLESLGYRTFMRYEKFRTTYSLSGVLVTLDELPFGNFSEIEGPNEDSLREISEALWLDWSQRSVMSYSALFDHIKSECGWTMENLAFEEFSNRKITPENLGLRYADKNG